MKKHKKSIKISKRFLNLLRKCQKGCIFLKYKNYIKKLGMPLKKQ